MVVVGPCDGNAVHPESDWLTTVPQLLPICDTLVGQAKKEKGDCKSTDRTG